MPPKNVWPTRLWTAWCWEKIHDSLQSTHSDNTLRRGGGKKSVSLKTASYLVSKNRIGYLYLTVFTFNYRCFLYSSCSYLFMIFAYINQLFMFHSAERRNRRSSIVYSARFPQQSSSAFLSKDLFSIKILVKCLWFTVKHLTHASVQRLTTKENIIVLLCNPGDQCINSNEGESHR